MSLPLGIGLVGLGHWGRNYLKTLLALPECRLVAVADPDPAARAAVANSASVTVCDSLEQLLSDPAVAATVIATPDRTHYHLAAAALAAGRDVLVEKPMTLSTSEAETLAGQAEDSSRVLAVGHTAVYATDIESQRTRLDAIPQAAGRHVRAERTSSGPSSAHSPLASAAPVGQCAVRHSAILFDLCPHDIALAILLFGTPSAARARPKGNGVEYEVRFNGDELLEGWAEWREPPHVRRFEVNHGKGVQGFEGPGVRRWSPGTVRPRAPNSNPEARDPSSRPEIRDTPLGRQCLDFIECCRTRRQPLSSGSVGLAVMRCLAGLDLSCADSGAWVPLPDLVHRPSSVVQK